MLVAVTHSVCALSVFVLILTDRRDRDYIVVFQTTPIYFNTAKWCRHAPYYLWVAVPLGEITMNRPI